MHTFNLSLLAGQLAVCQLDPNASIPNWATGDLLSITRTTTELSIVCEQENVPPEAKAERGWRCLRIEGPLDFTLVGVVASVANALADSDVALFVVSTFDTDYVLVKEEELSKAVESLRAAGHSVQT